MAPRRQHSILRLDRPRSPDPLRRGQPAAAAKASDYSLGSVPAHSSMSETIPKQGESVASPTTCLSEADSSGATWSSDKYKKDGKQFDDGKVLKESELTDHCTKADVLKHSTGVSVRTIAALDRDPKHDVPVGDLNVTAVEDLWRGQALTEARCFHQNREFGSVGHCGNCHSWYRFD